MASLTSRQAQVLRILREFIQESGFPPTRAEIAQALGFRSANAAEEHLKALARKGAIELLPGSSRGIRILDVDNEAVAGLPVVGRVAAGNPVLAIEHVEAHYALPADMFHPRADYLLRVQGMSMRDAGILDGDLLAVHQVGAARNGQVVVARIDDEVTVKRFRREGGQVMLLPENPDYKPITVDLRSQDLVIEGLGVGVIRNGRLL